MASKEVGILKHSAQNGFNVLLEGGHGVGKTAMVKEVFDDLGWKWKYFSASTIDPWVDLVGVPKEKDGVLELIRPASLDFDNVEAIFLDEYNRAPKKVRNAVMELIQFQSINGKKFPKLKVVFAAINPDDDDEVSYDVEKLDPAQIDRFHIHLPVPNEPCPYFFKNTYGSVGTLAVKWWQDQTAEVKVLISPRRLEAGLRVWQAQGDPQYVFDAEKVNIGEFSEYLDKPDPIALLDGLISKTDAEKVKFLSDPNQLKHVRKDLMGKERYLKDMAHLLPEIELMRDLRDKKGNKLIGHVVANVERFKHLIPSVITNATAYSGRVVEAFNTYRKSNNMGAAPTENRKVSIRGREFSMNKLAFCFTGKLASYKRHEAEEIINRYGGSTTNDVSFQTTHVISGDKTGAKIVRAKRQGVEILSEQDFYKIVQQLETPVAEKGLKSTFSNSNILWDVEGLEKAQKAASDKWHDEEGYTPNGFEQ